ncbi:MAG: hypothetical protein AAB495_03480 [Patescibacteria group bacterium]
MMVPRALTNASHVAITQAINELGKFVYGQTTNGFLNGWCG